MIKSLYNINMYVERKPLTDKFLHSSCHWGLDRRSQEFDAIVRRYADAYNQELIKAEEKCVLDKYFADDRTSSEYLYDVFNAWIVEDLVVMWLENGMSKFCDDFFIKKITF